MHRLLPAFQRKFEFLTNNCFIIIPKNYEKIVLFDSLSITGLLCACNDDKENGDGGELSFKFPLTEYESAKIGGKKVIGFSTVGDWTAEVKYNITPRL